MEITNFTPDNLRLLEADIREALKPIQAKYGLDKLQLMGGTYSATQFRTRIEAAPKGVQSNPQFINRQKSIAGMYGLPEDIIDFEFVSSRTGATYKVVRIDTKKPKYPVIATCIKACGNATVGSEIKAPVDYIQRLYNAAKNK